MINPKQIVGEKAAEFIEPGMTVGLGTGSTAYFTTQKVGKLVSNGLDIRCVPTSKSTEQLAQKWNIPLVSISEVSKIDITIDGADEVDPAKNLIKGGGGAHLREKIVASITEYYIIIVDNTKIVNYLGKFKLPVEVTPFAREVTQSQVNQLGCKSEWRKNDDDSYFISDNDNYILDCGFEMIRDPEELNLALNQIPGVVENGLFVGMADKIISSDISGNLKIY